jgi:two-component system alkaline phosphatase synthesis response regulator PhoP
LTSAHCCLRIGPVLSCCFPQLIIFRRRARTPESASAFRDVPNMARILCVDDEPHVVTLKCAILESAGHTVTASTSARDAMEKLQSNTYDAVVTDWRLGDANGRAVVQAAKNNSSMPVVVVSGYVAEAFQAAEPLADLYLEKPVNPEELVTIVNELLKSSERATSH